MLDRRVRYFNAIAEIGSLRGAATALRLSQPTLTKAIHNLEHELGCKLLERHGRGVRLTPTGQILARSAANIALEDRYARTEIEALNRGSRETLRIGSGSAWAIRYVPKAIATIMDKHPKLQLSVRVGVTDELVKLLIKGEVDICFGSLDGIQRGISVEFNYESLSTMNMIAFVRRQHPLLASNRDIGLADLLDDPWIVNSDTHYLRRLTGLFRDNGLPPPRMNVETSAPTTAFAVAEQTDCILCLPAAMEIECARYGLAPLPVILWTFQSGVWMHATAQRRSVVREFVEAIRTFIPPGG